MTNKDKLAEQIKELPPEDVYDLLHYVLLNYAMRYTDSRLAVIEWLKEEAEEREESWLTT